LKELEVFTAQIVVRISLKGDTKHARPL